MMQNRTLRRTLLLAVCVLVFLFALRAKVAVYNGNAPAKVTPTTSAKLWLSGQKMEVQSLDSSTAIWFWLALLSLFTLVLHRESIAQVASRSPLPSNVSLRYLHRFLRPPPFLA
jgi:hypothetical protein